MKNKSEKRINIDHWTQLHKKTNEYINNIRWHFGLDTEGNICKIEPYKVVITIKKNEP